MGLGGVISNLLSLGAKLLPVVTDFAQAPSSSSSPPVEGQKIEAELKQLMKLLKRIEVTLYDAEGREITDHSIKLWLEELREVAYDAEDVLDEYHYEVLRAQVEARHASQSDFPQRKQLITLPNDMYDKIKNINDKFADIGKDRIFLRLSDDDGRRRCNSEIQITPTSHFVIQSDVFGREEEKVKLVDMLCSECQDGKAITVVTIVGIGGLGKTTLAQLAYNNQRIKQRFDKYGWICVSEDFNVSRLTREAIESITERSCGMTNLSALQKKIREEIRGKRVLLVLDDVWNEDISRWELFQMPFKSANKQVVILVTTRNESVARIMQTVPSFNLGYMPQEHCWRLFQHYAFGENVINQIEDSTFVKIGKQIVDKCGKLPLAIKSVASLLRHEAQEEGWRDVLENELWKGDVDKAIFPALEISYTRLPTNLKPCFLYCSMFPKDYTFELTELVSLWASQGYIESNGKKSTKKIGQEYAKQLRQRSFFEDNNPQWEDFENYKFKLHDIVHDLARSKTENRCYSIQMGQDPDSSQKPYHLFVAGGVEQLNSLHSISFDALRTLIFMEIFYKEDVECDFDFSKAHKLRALELFTNASSKLVFSNDNLKHLRYLSLVNWPVLPKYLCSLYLLRKLTLRYCHFEELPKSIGNLVSLEEFIIYECRSLVRLPTEMGSLTNIQTLEISRTSVRSLPNSLNKIKGKIRVDLDCGSIGWLKDFVDIKGTLILNGLKNEVSLADARCANLVSLHNFECLWLFWDYKQELYYYTSIKGPEEGNLLQLDVLGNDSDLFIDDEVFDYFLMEILQPHPNLRELRIYDYPYVLFPDWIENPIKCAALEGIVIKNCQKLRSFWFGRLCKLKYLEIIECDGLQYLKLDSLLQLQVLHISYARALTDMTGIQNLESLVKLHIEYCSGLEFLELDSLLQLQVLEISCLDALIAMTGIQKLKSLVKLGIYDCSDLQLLGDSLPLQLQELQIIGCYELIFVLSGLNNLTSLKSLRIDYCPKLQAPIEEPRPIESCKIEISDCPGMKEWCIHHNIPYKEYMFR